MNNSDLANGNTNRRTTPCPPQTAVLAPEKEAIKSKIIWKPLNGLQGCQYCFWKKFNDFLWYFQRNATHFPFIFLDIPITPNCYSRTALDMRYWRALTLFFDRSNQWFPKNKHLCFIMTATNRMIYKRVKFGNSQSQMGVWMRAEHATALKWNNTKLKSSPNFPDVL